MTQEIQITPLDLSALIGSRICHDLISPLGAIANGVELMALTGAEKTPVSIFSVWHTALVAQINLYAKAS